MKELSMHYSFRNTVCGLAVLAAAGLLADKAAAQNVTLEKDTVALAPEAPSAMPGEISLFDDDMGQDISLPSDGGLISPSKPANAKPATQAAEDVIPMEVAAEAPAPRNAAPAKAPANISVADDFDDDEDINIGIESNDFEKPAPTISNTKVQGKLLGKPAAEQKIEPEEEIVPPLSNELFTKMSDLERQTTLLNLELKKERVRNEIEAVRAQRNKAKQEEEARQKEEERKQQEWQNEQERLMVEEQRKLREAEAALEKLRQEKIVKAYKATMLAATQKWINRNAEVYDEMARKESINKEMMDDLKKKMNVLKQSADDVKSKAEAARVAHDKKVANMESQISILKTRLEAEIEAGKKKDIAANAAKKNPFATGVDASGAPVQGKVKLSAEYAVMEIAGQGDELAAKLINNEGDVFLAKVGTTLRNGYTIDEIAKTYVSAVKDNEKDYLYFSAGGILDQEPLRSDINIKENEHKAGSGTPAASNRATNTTNGIPSLGQGMFVR